MTATKFKIAGITVVVVVLIALYITLFCKYDLDWLSAIGSGSIGILIGILLGFFVQETKKWDQAALITSVSLLSGAGIMGLLQRPMSVEISTKELWFYPITLLAGFLIGTIWDWKQD